MSPTWFSLSKSLVTPTIPPLPPAAGSRPESFLSAPHTVPTSGAHDQQALAAVPYHQMWEESRVWLPQLLQNTLNSAFASSSSAFGPTLAPPPSSQPTVPSPSPSENAGKYFIHHVQFVGGADKDVSPGGEDGIWYVMGERRLEWVDELPVEEWNAKRTFGRLVTQILYDRASINGISARSK
ncbi:hypothetical protein ABW20_dc0107977 [Dactylellina cionopaga]|nr:hypothetical protein ABW20_dc0107977 [Dactylellina cionopaga]